MRRGVYSGDVLFDLFEIVSCEFGLVCIMRKFVCVFMNNRYSLRKLIIWFSCMEYEWEKIFLFR